MNPDERAIRDLVAAWMEASRRGDTETVLSREDGGVTVVVTGSASDEELQEVAGSLRPYSG